MVKRHIAILHTLHRTEESDVSTEDGVEWVDVVTE